MAYDQATVERTREILRGRDDVVEKRMVGGLSFVVNGSMCCGVTGTALMIRGGPESRERADAGAVKRVPPRGSPAPLE